MFLGAAFSIGLVVSAAGAPLLNCHLQLAVPLTPGDCIGPTPDVIGVELVPLTSVLVASTSIPGNCHSNSVNETAMGFCATPERLICRTPVDAAFTRN
jgi:hypothetical protein